MANRCFWVSAAELVVHILTDGDCLQTHNNVTIFTRQLQWAMQQCKRRLNRDACEEPLEKIHTTLAAVSFQVAVNSENHSDVHDEDPEDVEVDIDKVEACTTSTNTADDYAHRGSRLLSMPYYVYRMYARRVRKPSRAKMCATNLFPFEPHYTLSRTYVQEVVLSNISVPTVNGFQCPTVRQDAEQNALFKAILFTPWCCTDASKCGSVMNFQSLLSNGSSPQEDGDASQLAASSSSSCPPPTRKYTFQRGWRLRRSEILVLADRADARCAAARKKLVMHDTVLFAERKEPLAAIEDGEAMKDAISSYCRKQLHRTMAANGLRLILEFAALPCKWHQEQCTLPEFCAYVARDVIAHIDLSAEARVKKPSRPHDNADSDCDSDSDAPATRTRPTVEFTDVGGGATDALDVEDDDAAPSEISSFPIYDIGKTISICLQQEELASLSSKTRKSQGDLDLQAVDETYAGLLKGNFGLTPSPLTLETRGFGVGHTNMLVLQKQVIALAKKQQSGGTDSIEAETEDNVGDLSSASQPAAPEVVPLSLALQGPGAVALDLLRQATCTEEQIDAVAVLALSLQKRFDARVDKQSIRLPAATADGNHRAIWLGGGGVGKTHTLMRVVQPLAETYFGPDGYAATAQSNHAAQNLGSRGRTLHNSNGLLMTDSLQTARLRLNAQTQKKMDRLVGNLGVEVIDELGCVPAPLLHADALRKTYGRCQRHNLDTTQYMKPSETWGRMPSKILCGDFYQLPPVPASASLLAPVVDQSYEHQQGRKLLLDMEYVHDFVQMQRFDDPLLVEVLEAMRTPGGKQLSEAAWKALEATVIQTSASQPVDPRLRDARGWYECAYEWRIVSYAMHAHARLNAQALRKTLFYIPSIDVPSVRMTREEFDEMRQQPNISASAKFPGVLPIYIGMEMILTESFLPPQIVRGAPVEVVDIEFHPKEAPILDRDSIASHGCVVLQFMPKCIYVRVRDCKDVFLVPAASAAQPDMARFAGLIAVQPTTRPWSFKSKTMAKPVSVSRTQCPLLPKKQCTLHGVQGKTADPGFIAHWKFPRGLSAASKWLAYYVSLSRPRGFSRLLCHGLPDRNIIEGGPPKSITDAFDELFSKKVASTKLASASARALLKWPPRADLHSLASEVAQTAS
jgi:hypothetical protein